MQISLTCNIHVLDIFFHFLAKNCFFFFSILVMQASIEAHVPVSRLAFLRRIDSFLEELIHFVFFKNACNEGSCLPVPP
jgi:hypothetical protein